MGCWSALHYSPEWKRSHTGRKWLREVGIVPSADDRAMLDCGGSVYSTSPSTLFLCLRPADKHI